MVLHRFSGLGKAATDDAPPLIEKKLLYESYARKGTKYIGKEAALRPCYEFPEKLPEDKSQLRISKIKFDEDEKKVKKLTKERKG